MSSNLTEYPRPQLVRDSYISLNGEWEYAISKNPAIPSSFDGNINVPYSPETPLSGVNKIVHPDEWLFYRKELEFPEGFIRDKVILHFGAVDQIAEVYLNDQLVGTHVGGFLPFSFDIKPFLKEKNVLIVKVKDYSDTSYYSRGKQRIKRGGIWYSPQSGIYMPVWMESVSNDYVESIKLTPDIDKKVIKLLVKSSSKKVEVVIEGTKRIISSNKEMDIQIKSLHLWSPENPYLYPLEIKTEHDRIKSYFAMRKISLKKDRNGHQRIALNNKPYFIKGVLDQGYFRNGYLTPEKDEDYIKDIEMLKKLGFNCARKHIKIESLRWYYHCDRLGLLVWQDFVNGGTKYNLPTIALPLITGWHWKDTHYGKFGRRNKQGRLEAEQEFKDTINLLYNVPSIVLWTIFNEGWGQFDSKRIYGELKKIDSTRLYDHASGWHDQGVSETKSLHVYFKRVKIPKEKKIKDRAVILSEAGGYALKVEGHTFNESNFGYKKMQDQTALENEYETFINEDVKKNIPQGLSAFIYTQLSDVEDELNGFVTYDREVLKVGEKRIKTINDSIKM